jgi:hypothetical protein
MEGKKSFSGATKLSVEEFNVMLAFTCYLIPQLMKLFYFEINPTILIIV